MTPSRKKVIIRRLIAADNAILDLQELFCYRKLNMPAADKINALRRQINEVVLEELR